MLDDQIPGEGLHLRDVMGIDYPYLTPITFLIRVHVWDYIYSMLAHYYLVCEKPEDGPFISRSGVQGEKMTWTTVPCLWVVVY